MLKVPGFFAALTISSISDIVPPGSFLHKSYHGKEKTPTEVRALSVG
jgi:hypothetical protein